MMQTGAPGAGVTRIRRDSARRLMSVVAILVSLLGATLAGSPAARAAADARSWITIGSTQPGAGCSVGVSVEVRSGGEAVTGVTVEIAFFDAQNNPISTDTEYTGDDGVAFLGFDTSGLGAGGGWLDINLDGAYVAGTAIVPRNNAGCDDDNVVITADSMISGGGSISFDGVGIDGIPVHQQQRSLSCEYAAVQIATSAFGDPIYEDDYLYDTPQTENPHNGFRGDIDGAWGDTDDYGIYAEALVPNLEAHGYVGEVSYGADAGYLAAQIDAGHPTLVWIATRGDTGFYDEDANGNRFKLVPYEHVVVAFGYDDGGVYISDPGSASYSYLSWGWFLDAWNVLDGMALSIYPAG